MVDFVETAPEHLVDKCVEMLIEFNTLPKMALLETDKDSEALKIMTNVNKAILRNTSRDMSKKFLDYLIRNAL